MQESFDPQAVRSRLTAMRAEDRHLRLRDAAERLGASEAEVIASFCGASATRLRPEWKALLEALPELGPVLALTRNQHAVIEKQGCFENVDVQGHAGLVLGTDIDLRLFLDSWHSGFALADDADVGLRRSLQIFDDTGAAVHKVFLLEESNAAAFDEIVRRFAAAEQSTTQAVVPPRETDPERPDAEIDVATLRRDWAEMKDTHDFVFLLRRLGVTRTQALRLVDREWAEPVGVGSLRRVLESAAASGLPIMVFIGNRGAIEIHTGPVQRVRVVGEWLNVLDPTFNLHIFEPGLASAWVVRKPTTDGIVTALELYDGDGDNVALLFGKRKPGEKELPAWRQLVKEISST